jgi:hypothetical protein
MSLGSKTDRTAMFASDVDENGALGEMEVDRKEVEHRFLELDLNKACMKSRE